MSTVVLRLAGPLQSWGSGSRFVRRATEMEPTKSGVLGLIAAARGLSRDEPLGKLAQLRFGVRADQPGQLLHDFHTAQQQKKQRDGSVEWRSLPLSHRYYLADAVYLAVLEGERELVEAVDAAVRAPRFPLYLGRRSCPPAGPIAIAGGVSDDDLATVLSTRPWLASVRVQERHRSGTVSLGVVRDLADGETGNETARDVPVSFDPNRRQYAWRSVIRSIVELPNPSGEPVEREEHDPMSSLGV